MCPSVCWEAGVSAGCCWDWGWAQSWELQVFGQSLCFCGTQPSLGTMSLGVMLTGAHPLLFSLSDGPGVKEHRLGTWGHMFI